MAINEENINDNYYPKLTYNENMIDFGPLFSFKEYEFKPPSYTEKYNIEQVFNIKRTADVQQNENQHVEDRCDDQQRDDWCDEQRTDESPLLIICKELNSQLSSSEPDVKSRADKFWTYCKEYLLRISNNLIDSAFIGKGQNSMLIELFKPFLSEFPELEVFSTDDGLRIMTNKKYEQSVKNILLSLNKFPSSFIFDYLACFTSLYFTYLLIKSEFVNKVDANIFKKYVYSTFMDYYKGVIREVEVVDEKKYSERAFNYFIHHIRVGPQVQLLEALIV